MLPGAGPQEVGEEAIRVAILGRPNVGKSSLLNAILGEERVIVSEVPGTTRDSIDTVLQRGERTFVLVDTAGLRRKRKQRQGIEYYSELRALAAAERADVALVLVDASEGLVDQDLSVADIARKAQNSTIVVLSKWDIGQLVARGRARPLLSRGCASGRRSSPSPPRPAAASARLLDRIETLFEKHTSRIATPELNRFLGRACARRASRPRRPASGSTSSTAPRCRRGRRASASSSTIPP